MELAVAARLAASFQVLTLEIDALSGSDKLTETLFVNFQENEEIKDIYSQLHANVHSASSYELHPHLSLLYQKLTAQERDLLIEETAIGLQSIQFNELWAVAIPEQLSSLDDFRGWQTLLTCRLAPRKNVDTIY
ncbi:MAG: hypothetical protein GWO08_01345 [Gammaproteobacteria bacterium]|nr:hypothetical protein [Gammaproteobacteria bacterium]NIR92352.1 hypothetical protein [Gammaproteobacteria bacterium]